MFNDQAGCTALPSSIFRQSRSQPDNPRTTVDGATTETIGLYEDHAGYARLDCATVAFETALKFSITETE